jgi:rubrerythrin
MKISIRQIEKDQHNFAIEQEKQELERSRQARETKKPMRVSEQTAENIRNMINKVTRHLNQACPTFTHSDNDNVIRLEVRL